MDELSHLITFLNFTKSLVIAPLPASVIMTHWVRKSICDSHIKIYNQNYLYCCLNDMISKDGYVNTNPKAPTPYSNILMRPKSEKPLQTTYFVDDGRPHYDICSHNPRTRLKTEKMFVSIRFRCIFLQTLHRTLEQWSHHFQNQANLPNIK